MYLIIYPPIFATYSEYLVRFFDETLVYAVLDEGFLEGVKGEAGGGQVKEGAQVRADYDVRGRRLL